MHAGLACGARKKKKTTCLARCFKSSMSGFRSLCVCLMKTFCWLIPVMSSNGLRGNVTAPGGTASPCINRQASLRCISPLRRLRPPVCRIPPPPTCSSNVPSAVSNGPCEGLEMWSSSCCFQTLDCFGFHLAIEKCSFSVSLPCMWGSKQTMTQIFAPPPPFVIALSHRFQMTRGSREDSWLKNSNSTRGRG